MSDFIGIYIHVPFCLSKCPYCDFYSKIPQPQEMESYLLAMDREIAKMAKKYPRKVDTVYFGGGTPSALGGEGLARLLAVVRRNFEIATTAEITAELNPESVSKVLFQIIKKAGFNRISMGLQSANEDELEFLGRKHSLNTVENAVNMARAEGFDNISLDLMIALPNQTEEKLRKSIEFCSNLGVEHISSYILKVEENTVFGRKNIEIPDDDTAGDLYLYSVELLEKLGYKQYEISNFAKNGFESKHNTKYWQLKEYLGIGPSAHSFMERKRFFYKRGLKSFIEGAEVILDGSGGDFEEYVMLSLRLNKGIDREIILELYPNRLEEILRMFTLGKKLPQYLLECDEEKISLKSQGMLVSNSIINYLLEK